MKNLEQHEQYYSVKKLARLLEVEVHTVYYWIKTRKLQSEKTKFGIGIPKVEADKFIDEYRSFKEDESEDFSHFDKWDTDFN